jgi:predicted dehydrogenase
MSQTLGKEKSVITLAVIGCGRWGPNHVRTFNTLPGSGVDAVADPDKARLEHMCGIYPGLLRYEQDYRPIVDDPTIDALVISTPAKTHAK